MSWLVAHRECLIGGLAILLAFLAAVRGVYRRGYKAGREFARIEGGYCEVCNTVSDKFVVFRMTVTCRDCFNKIMSNREMKCRLCNEPIEKCACV